MPVDFRPRPSISIMSHQYLTNSKQAKCKRVLLLLLLSFVMSLNLVQAQEQQQPYQSIFGQDSTKWTMIPFGYCDIIVTVPVETLGSAVKDGKEYTRVSNVPHGIEKEDFLVREDVITGRVWIYDPVEDNEMLVMDMTLEEGDKFAFASKFDGDVEIQVEKVYYEDGLKHIRFRKYDITASVCLRLEPAPFEFIEGTGPTASIFYPYYYSRGGNTSVYVLCHFKDEERVYSGELGSGECYITVMGTGEDAKAKTTVELYPNPATDAAKFTFNNPRQEQAELVLLDVLSRPVQRLSGSGSAFMLRLQSIPAGVYFYKLRLGNRQVASGKFIKQ
ncbi:T9SS type A sorting domain-containing protein [Pontibacter sp. 13R65]|uniref:T9SS type A sorting domain-containing protein n=1 Tax=Pontibacter sp. 13R65 TaxID=3127458 RepID=UPI00301C2794